MDRIWKKQEETQYVVVMCRNESQNDVVERKKQKFEKKA